MEIRTLFSATLAAFVLAPAAALAAPPVSDDFSAANIDLGTWTIVDPVGDGGFQVAGNELQISVPGGVSHDIWTSGNDAPRLVQPVDDADFGIEAKFSTMPGAKYQLQGILVEAGNGNFIRFDVFSTGRRVKIFSATFTSGSPSTEVNTRIRPPGSDVYLRVDRSGNSWTFDYSFDGSDWSTAANFTHALNVQEVGVYAGNAGGSPPAYTASVDYFFNVASPIVPEDGGSPTIDTTPPSIINPTVSAVSETEVVVAWNTDEPADSTVRYGLSTNYEIGTLYDPTLRTSHSVLIGGLSTASTYQIQFSTADAAGNTATSNNFSTSTSAVPTIDVWYGNDQTFGAIGQPQTAINLLGNVSDPDGITAFSYSLNGAPAQGIGALGPDNKRLQDNGDFNIEFDFNALQVGANTVELIAVDGIGLENRETVTINYPGRNFWPETYIADWSQASSIEDLAQVVDGNWTLSGGGVRTTQIGYDRIVAMGDVTWTDYEAVVPITVHSLDPRCNGTSFCAGSGPLVGLLARWPGHTFWGSLPNHGWYPMGAFSVFRWRDNGDPVGVEFYSGTDGSVVAQNKNKSFGLGTPHFMKIRAETLGSSQRYSAKVWSQNEAEPANWDIVIDEPLSSTSQGSLLLVAHHVDATFGTAVVTPLSGGPGPDTIPPVISGVSATGVTETSATIIWTTDEAADSAVAYGTTQAYENGTVSSPSPVTAHSITLNGLSADTTYNYQVTSIDASNKCLEHVEPDVHDTAGWRWRQPERCCQRRVQRCARHGPLERGRSGR